MFLKRIWKARRGFGLNKFSIDGQPPVEVVNVPDSVTEAGDPISAENLNDLENRIASEFATLRNWTETEPPARQQGDADNETLALGLVTTQTFHATATSDTVTISVSSVSGYTPLGVLDIYVGATTYDYWFINGFTFDPSTMKVTVTGYWAHNDTIYAQILYVKNS